MLQRLAREADVGERDRVAVAIAAGGGVFEVRFERDERSGVPMLAPFDARRLIELEFVFQIFAHAPTISGCGQATIVRGAARARGPGRRAAAAAGSDASRQDIR